jgi:hypothetical protein
MQSERVRPSWDDIGFFKLLAGVFVGPLAWGLNLQINYSLMEWACGTGHATVLTLVSVVALIAVVAGFALSWRCWTRLRNDADLRGARIIDRSYFLAIAGLSLNALFALLILTSVSLHGIVSPCE